MKVKIKRLDPRAQLPEYQTAGAACFDIHALLPKDDGRLLVSPGEQFAFSTGLAFEIPPGYVLKVFSRSGHGFNNGVRLANGTGIIDSDYRGELKVALRADPHPGVGIAVKHGDRIAQGMIVPSPRVEWDEVDELSDTERGAGGFGSTGVSKP